MTQTKLTRRNLLCGAASGLFVLPGTASPQSQSWPSKPVMMVVPFPAGGGTDAFARPFAAQFAKQTGKQLIVDNRGGAGGTLGASLAARAAADGYNLFMGAVHHTIAESMYPKLDYDLQKDFVALTLLARVPQVLVVNPQRVNAPDTKSFIKLVKSNPGKYNYASGGSGTSHHLAGELFKQQSGTFITHIPYRGAGPALQDLIAGNVDVLFDGLGSSVAHVQGGRIKALMIAGDKRSPALPDVPCAAEVGLPDYTVSTWYGLWAPKNTPTDVQQSVVAQIRKVMTSDEIKTIWARNGAEFPDLSQQQFAAHVRDETARWSRVVKESGTQLD